VSISCEHGYLARSCQQCDDKHEIQRLTARVAELTALLTEVYEVGETSALHERIRIALADGGCA
jgi:hypothetical protein